MDYNKYPDGHWNTITDRKVALDKYLSMYDDVYSQNNLDRITLSVANISKDKKMRVLDFGGGIGILSIALAKRGHFVTLVEGSKASIETAKYYAKKSQVNIDTVHIEDDATLLEEDFDIIIMKDVIEHINNDSGLLSKLSKYLRVGGTLLMSTQNNYSANYIIEGIARKVISPRKQWLGWDPTHVRWYNYKKLNHLLLNTGFEDFKYTSSYIVPYKLLLHFMPWVDSKKDSWLYRLDLKLQKIKIFNKIGWNILVVCSKK
jgi:2-polyprenyl-6-hydroxyphenyl methylase / 3-demethylubiquinone-9 3-methyltransferase